MVVRAAIGIVLITLALPAGADTFHTIVNYRCEPSRNRLIISLKGAYNEEGTRLLKNKGPNTWDPWEFVAADKSGERIISTSMATRTCRLAADTFDVEIGPVIGNRKVVGLCGGAISAYVIVSGEATKYKKLTLWQNFCSWSREDTVVTEAIFSPKLPKPKLIRIPVDEFVWGSSNLPVEADARKSDARGSR